MVPNHRPWSATAAGTNGGATATQAAVSGVAHFVTSISGHTDTDSLIQILDDTTVVWQSAIDISVEGFQIKSPANLCVPITPGNACSVKVVTSTSDCQVNGNGYSIP